MSAPPLQIEHHKILDPLDCQDRMAIEVELLMSDGSRRWCLFAHHTAMNSFGDWIDGTEVSFHRGAPHMFVVGALLTDDLIAAALATVQREGDVSACTLPVHGDA